jgi:hypothetical protein
MLRLFGYKSLLGTLSIVMTNNIRVNSLDRYFLCHYNCIMSKKRGAPKKAVDERKAAVTQIRLLATEKEGFEEAAELAGLSLSSWMRERLRAVAKRELGEHGQVAAFLPRKKP